MKVDNLATVRADFRNPRVVRAGEAVKGLKNVAASSKKADKDAWQSLFAPHVELFSAGPRKRLYTARLLLKRPAIYFCQKHIAIQVCFCYDLFV